MGLKRSDHVTPILKNLHWLPVEKRLEFTTVLITYKTIHSQSADCSPLAFRVRRAAFLLRIKKNSMAAKYILLVFNVILY